jgi:hypothetical protein
MPTWSKGCSNSRNIGMAGGELTRWYIQSSLPKASVSAGPEFTQGANFCGIDIPVEMPTRTNV